MEVTGERYIPEIVSPEISYEHWHRYLFATRFVNNKQVLDIACGEGYGSDLLASVAKSVVGVDVSQDAINHASSRYLRDNLEFRCGEASNIPFQGEAVFDVVVSFETIEHLDEANQRDFLKEIKRLMKPQGIFLLSTPNKQIYSDIPGYKNPFHLKEFYEQELNKFLKKYFRFVRILGQKPYTGSYIWDPLNQTSKMSEYKLEFSINGFRPSHDTKVMGYFLAVCSDEPLEGDCASILIDLSERMMKLKEESAMLREQLMSQERQLTEVYQSHSWRITKPLRAISNGVRCIIDCARRGS